MDVIDAIKARTSVRSYSDEPVPEESMERILEAARLAPSAMNYQPWHFIVVRDKGRREELSKGRYAKFLKESPVVVVGCGDRKRSPHWYSVDVTIAMQNMVLAATAEGLGTCWIGSFDEDSVKKALGVPEHMTVVAMLSVGYSKKKLDLAALLVGSKTRKKMEDIVSYESF
jgi:nitroreductase